MLQRANEVALRDAPMGCHGSSRAHMCLLFPHSIGSSILVSCVKFPHTSFTQCCSEFEHEFNAVSKTKKSGPEGQFALFSGAITL